MPVLQFGGAFLQRCKLIEADLRSLLPAVRRALAQFHLVDDAGLAERLLGMSQQRFAQPFAGNVSRQRNAVARQLGHPCIRINDRRGDLVHGQFQRLRQVRQRRLDVFVNRRIARFARQ